MVVAQAAAQSDEDRAAARAIAMQGVAQEEAEHWTEAIDLFRRAESLVHAPPHLLHIARAEVKLRRLVAGRESYLAIAREELSTNAPRAFVDAQAAAQKELAELEPRIPTLKVLVDGGQGAVTADGAPMSSALIGVERPIDPGRHELRAAGSGMASKLVVIDLAEGVHETVHLLLEPSGAATPTDDSPSTSTEMERSGGSKVGAFVAWGVGAAGLVVGTTMMLVNRSKRDEADAICPSGSCPTSRRADVESLDADANRAATLSWVGFGVGVVGLGVGTVLFFMKGGKPANEPQHAAAAVVPWVGVGGAGLSGRF